MALSQLKRLVEMSSPTQPHFCALSRNAPSRISNQFRKIELWLKPREQPFEISFLWNDIKKSASALHYNIEKFETSQPKKVNKFTILHRKNRSKFRTISKNSTSAQNLPLASFPHIARRVPKHEDCVKNSCRIQLLQSNFWPTLLTLSRNTVLHVKITSKFRRKRSTMVCDKYKNQFWPECKGRASWKFIKTMPIKRSFLAKQPEKKKQSRKP